MIKYALPVAVLYFASPVPPWRYLVRPCRNSPARTTSCRWGARAKAKAMVRAIRGTPIATITTTATITATIIATITSIITTGATGATAIATGPTTGRPSAASPLVQSGTARNGSLVNLDDRVVEDEYRAVGRVATVSLFGLIANRKGSSHRRREPFL
jgi:hypothetical protein